MKKDSRNWIIVLAAIISITILEAIALLKNIDGKLLSFSFTLIGGLGGFYFKSLPFFRRRFGE